MVALNAVLPRGPVAMTAVTASGPMLRCAELPGDGGGENLGAGEDGGRGGEERNRGGGPAQTRDAGGIQLGEDVGGAVTKVADGRTGQV